MTSGLGMAGASFGKETQAVNKGMELLKPRLALCANGVGAVVGVQLLGTALDQRGHGE